MKRPITEARQRDIESWAEPESVYYTSAYVKRLLIERHGIRAALENPGGSIIVSATRKVETDQMQLYSSMIGNDFELDLIDCEAVVNTFSPEERFRLLTWVDGLPSEVAADYARTKPETIRKRGQRIAKKVSVHLNEQRGIAVAEHPKSPVIVRRVA